MSVSPCLFVLEPIFEQKFYSGFPTNQAGKCTVFSKVFRKDFVHFVNALTLLDLHLIVALVLFLFDRSDCNPAESHLQLKQQTLYSRGIVWFR